MERRNIDLGPEDLTRLRGAIDALARRGAQHSVVMLDQRAFVVNVPSGTVVTAVEAGAGKESLFTNVDSVVIA
jgi:flagellar operon protein